MSGDGIAITSYFVNNSISYGFQVEQVTICVSIFECVYMGYSFTSSKLFAKLVSRQ